MEIHGKGSLSSIVHVCPIKIGNCQLILLHTEVACAKREIFNIFRFAHVTSECCLNILYITISWTTFLIMTTGVAVSERDGWSIRSSTTNSFSSYFFRL